MTRKPVFFKHADLPRLVAQLRPGRSRCRIVKIARRMAEIMPGQFEIEELEYRVMQDAIRHVHDHHKHGDVEADDAAPEMETEAETRASNSGGFKLKQDKRYARKIPTNIHCWGGSVY